MRTTIQWERPTRSWRLGRNIQRDPRAAPQLPPAIARKRDDRFHETPPLFPSFHSLRDRQARNANRSRVTQLTRCLHHRITLAEPTRNQFANPLVAVERKLLIHTITVIRREHGLRRSLSHRHTLRSAKSITFT